MEWKEESPVKLIIGVQVDANGNIIESEEGEEIAATKNQIFEGFPASLTSDDAKQAYDALTSTFGYNAKDTETVVMQINKKDIFAN